MVTILLIVSRALHLGSGMLMVAVVAFRWFVLLPAFKRSPEQMWTMFSPLFDRLKHLLLWSGAILLVSGLMLFWSVSAAMSGNSLQESLTSETFGTVLFQTQFGSIVLGHFALEIEFFWLVKSTPPLSTGIPRRMHRRRPNRAVLRHWPCRRLIWFGLFVQSQCRCRSYFSHVRLAWRSSTLRHFSRLRSEHRDRNLPQPGFGGGISFFFRKSDCGHSPGRERNP
jgi:hypothetical protein